MDLILDKNRMFVCVFIAHLLEISSQRKSDFKAEQEWKPLVGYVALQKEGGVSLLNRLKHPPSMEQRTFCLNKHNSNNTYQANI